MGRRAKDAAQQKISQWTGARSNVSKATTKSENTNASNENRIPLQTHSPSDLNAMKNCTVRLDKLQIPDNMVKPTRKAPKTPAKTIPAADVTAKDKPNDAKNVYDYSFDADEPSPLENIPDMKDVFEKLAKENKIEVKKYRPKNAKKKKPNETDADSKAAAAPTKRRREKQPADVEPPKKKPNLKSKVIAADAPKSVAPSAGIARPKRTENVANNNVATKKVATIAPTVTKTAIQSNALKPVDTAHSGYVNAQQRLRNRNEKDFQSTPKSSTPLGAKATAANNAKNRSLNSLFFDNVSPMMTSIRSTRGNVQRQRLQLSAIQDSPEEVPTTSKGHIANENAAQSSNFDYNDFDFGNDLINEPDLEVDKENSLDRPSTSAAASRSSGRSETATSASSAQNRQRASPVDWDQPSTSAAAFKTPDKSKSASSHSNVQNRNATSSMSHQSRDQPSTSAVARTPLNNSNDRSIFNIQETSEYNIFSPTKRRVYGRSPLKNITSEVNNTNSPSFDSSKSPAVMPRSFGILAKSTGNSLQTITPMKSSDLTLPEASYFTSRRAPQDFDRIVDNQKLVDDCFGFDLDDDEETILEDTTNDESQYADKTAINNSKSAVPEKGTLKEIREKLKRFLHNPEAESNESVKKAKVTKSGKGKAKKDTTPIKNSPAKTANAKPKRNVVFGEAAAKQKDIRSAFTGKPGDKDKQAKSNSAQNEPVINLFSEVETVQDRRRSYSRPQRQRKRRLSIDSDESEAEEQHSEDEEYDESGKASKRVKRRKKTTKSAETNPKELEELEEFARKTNQHFDEVDSFELMVE